MRIAFAYEPRVRVTKENINELIEDEKRKIEQTKRNLQHNMLRDGELTAQLHHQADISYSLWNSIAQIRNGRITSPELIDLKNEITEVFRQGVRTNVLRNVPALAQLEDMELTTFMNLLKDKRNGQDLNFVSLIPFFKYKVAERLCKDQICSVCHEDYMEEEECIQLSCKHVFHRRCITQWLNLKRNCPMCKKEVKRQKLKQQEPII